MRSKLELIVQLIRTDFDFKAILVEVTMFWYEAVLKPTSKPKSIVMTQIHES